MTITTPSITTTPQIIAIVTVETIQSIQYSSIICPITAVLTPVISPGVFASVSADYSTINVDASKIVLSTDIRTHAFTLTVSSANFSNSVASQTYNFNVIIVCTVTQLYTTPFAENQIQTLNYPSIISNSVSVIQNSACMFPYSYSHTYTNFYTDVNIAAPSWISFDTTNQRFTVSNITLPSDIGLYTITTKVTIPQIDQSTGNNRFTSYSFKLLVQSDCVFSQITKKTIDDMYVFVTLNSTQDITFLDSVSTNHSNQSYCGARTYVLSPSLSYLSITGTTLTLTTNNPNDESINSVQLTVTLTDYPTVTPLHTNFKVTIQCNVFSINTLLTPPTISSYRILVDPPLVFSFAFQAFPACNLVYNVTPPQNFSVITMQQNSQIIITSFYLPDANTYNLQLSATPQLGVSTSVNFDVKLIDVCKTLTFFSQKIKNLEILKESSSFQQIQVIQFNEFDYSAKLNFNVECGSQIKTLQLQSGQDLVPNWICLDQNYNKVKIDFRDQVRPVKEFLQIFVSFKNYPDRNITETFTIALSSQEIKCSVQIPLTYKIGQPDLKFVQMYQNNTVVDQIKLTPQYTPVAFDSNQRKIEFPKFIGYFEQQKIFSIRNAGYNDVGTYYIGLSIGYTEYPLNLAQCTTQITVQYVANFTGNPISDQILTCNDTKWSFKLPSYNDIFGYEAVVEVNLGEASIFLSYDDQAGQIKTRNSDLTSLASFEGNYKILIKLTDSVGVSSQLSFVVQLLCFNETYSKGVQSKKFKQPPPVPFIQFIGQDGRVRVGFSRQLVLPTYTIYPQFKTDDLLRLNCTNGQNCSGQRLLNIQSQNQTQDEQEAIEIVNKGIIPINNTIFPVVDLIMIPGPESNSSQLNFTWECVSFRPMYMDFRVNFIQYNYVSIHDQEDAIKVRFYGNQYFRAPDYQTFKNDATIIQKPMPPQINPATSNSFIVGVKTVNALSKAFIIGQFCMKFFLGTALQQLFATIKKLQIMMHLLIVNIRIPANAQFFFSSLLSFVTFNIYDISDPIRQSLKLPVDEDIIFNRNLYKLGYQSNYFVINFGNLFFVMLYLFILLMLNPFLELVESKRLKTFLDKIFKGLIWNQILGFIDQNFLLIAVSCFVNLKNLKFRKVGTVVSSIFAIFAAFTLLVHVFCVLILLKKNMNQLHYETFKAKYSVIYENLNYIKGGAVLLEPFFNSCRILMLTSTLIFLQDYSYFQIFFSNFQVTSMIIYYGWTQPFKEKSFSFFQSFNELFICIVNYHIMCFAHFIQDEPTRNIMGWSLIAFVSSNIFINFAYISQDGIKKAYFKLRLKYYQNKLKRLQDQKRKNEFEVQQRSNTNLSIFLSQKIKKREEDPIEDDELRFYLPRVSNKNFPQNVKDPNEQDELRFYLSKVQNKNFQNSLSVIGEEEKAGGVEQSGNSNFSYNLNQSESQLVRPIPKLILNISEDDLEQQEKLNELEKQSENLVEAVFWKNHLPFSKAQTNKNKNNDKNLLKKRTKLQKLKKKQDNLTAFQQTKNNSQLLSLPYKQPLENSRYYQAILDDPASHSIRVAKRHQKVNDQIKSPDQTRNMFEGLWIQTQYRVREDGHWTPDEIFQIKKEEDNNHRSPDEFIKSNQNH